MEKHDLDFLLSVVSEHQPDNDSNKAARAAITAYAKRLQLQEENSLKKDGEHSEIMSAADR
jgi:hypothetical protein